MFGALLGRCGGKLSPQPPFDDPPNDLDYTPKTMKDRHRSLRISGETLLTVLLLVTVFCLRCTAETGDISKRFYDRLMERGYCDTAIDYVDSLRNQPNCPKEIADELDYLAGRAYLARVKTASPAERDLFLKRSRELLLSFLEKNPDHPDAFEANAQLASVTVREGEKLLAGISDQTSDVEKTRIQQSARDIFDQAAGAFDQAENLARDQIIDLQSDDAKAHSPEANLFYGRYLDLLLNKSRLLIQKADTYPPDAPEQAELLVNAKAAFHRIYEKYQAYPGGYRAFYEEARIENRLGHTEEALAILDEISQLPMQPALYVLKTESLALFGEITRGDKKPERLMEMIRGYNGWKVTGGLPENFYTSAEGLSIHLATAQAALALLDLRQNDRETFNTVGKAVFSEKSDSAIKLMAHLDKVAFEALDFVRQQKSPLSIEAEKLIQTPALAKLLEEAPQTVPHDFSEALLRVNRSWSLFVQLNSDGAAASQDEQAKKIRAEVEQAVRLALSMSAKAESIEVDNLRLQWGTFKLLTDQTDDALIIFDFLCRHRQSFSGATKAAELSIRAMRGELRRARKQGDQEKIARLNEDILQRTDYIIKRWGEGFTEDIVPAVQDAVAIQIESAIAAGQMEKALERLNQIPEGTASWAAAKLQLGQALWNDYALRQEEGTADQASQNHLRAQAREALADGLSRRLELTSGGNESDTVSVYAALSLAQIAMSEKNAEEAIRWLSHPKIGPLTLAERSAARLFGGSAQSVPPAENEEIAEDDTEADDQHPTEEGTAETSEGGSSEPGVQAARTASSTGQTFQITALTLALRAYVQTGDFQRAEEVMASLEKFASIGQGSEERLTGIYLQLGKQLEDQLHWLRAEAVDDPKAAEEIDKLSEGFESFLDRCSTRSAGNTYQTLRWIADTFYSLGMGLLDEGKDAQMSGEQAQKAQKYFEKGGRTYLAILKKIDSDPAWTSVTTAKTIASVRLAECLQKVGRYPQALKYLLPLLTENENNLELQFTAASLYEAWGSLDKTYYIRAIQGGEPQKSGKNLIWGWNRIVTTLSRSLAKSDQYKERFYEAVVHKVRCRIAWMRTLTGAEEIKKQAVGGINELYRLAQVQPDLGGPKYRSQLDDLLKEFQTAAGEPAVGFKQPKESSADQ